MIKPDPTSEYPGDVLQSLNPLKKSAPPAESNLAKNSAGGAQAPKAAHEATWSAPEAGTTGKRNYPALAAALQTLGYSVPGFIAAAVVALDGTPIAQVAMDERDISSLCPHFSSVVQGTLRTLEPGEDYEQTIITSRRQHILLRLIGTRRDIFQALIIARETNPAESLEVMANVEAAISAAL
jgi:predicted regulator of Ras-like GTPase activity (Roadblock/LC7/MglB family)